MSYDNTSLFDAVSFSERNEFNYHVISLYFLWRITVKGAGVGKREKTFWDENLIQTEII